MPEKTEPCPFAVDDEKEKYVMKGVLTRAFAFAAVLAASVSGAEAQESPWDGFYAGLQLGAVIGRGDVSIPAYSSSFVTHPTSFAGGLYAGYGFDFGSGFYAGLEADVNAVTAHKKHLSGGATGEVYHFKQNFDSSVRARFGMDMGGYMPYLTGGLAIGRMQARYEPTTGGTNWKNDTRVGWTVGAGVEMQLFERTSARIQYRYTDYGKASYSHTRSSKVDYTSHIIQLGLSYKF